MNDKISTNKYFEYHPPITDERKIAHDAINRAALAFAKEVEANVQDEDCRKFAFFAIQQARMFANQGITVDEMIWLNSQNVI